MADETAQKRRRLAWVVAVAVLLAAGLAVGGRLGTRSSPEAVASTTLAAPSARPAALAPGAAALQDAYVRALKVATPSVVEISTSSGLGSGVVYDKAGDVVTNAHVVGSATNFSVLLANGSRTSARLVGRFAPDDLAVIRLASTKGAKPATFANSATLQVGDLALAIGSPFGLSGSVTDGIVSSTGRTVSEPGGVLLPDTIQTSAAINPGNSGGALVDAQGRVIGITSVKLAAAKIQGLGFAIPADTLRSILKQYQATGQVVRPWLGVTLSEPWQVEYGLPTTKGLTVADVAANSPAAAAGLQVGDQVLAFDGQPVHTVDGLIAVLWSHAVGDTVSMTIDRGGTHMQLQVTLAARPASLSARRGGGSAGGNGSIHP